MLRSKSVSSIGTLIVCDRSLSHFALDKTVTWQIASVIDWARVQARVWQAIPGTRALQAALGLRQVM